MSTRTKTIIVATLTAGTLVWFWFFNIHPTPTFYRNQLTEGDIFILKGQPGLIGNLGIVVPYQITVQDEPSAIVLATETKRTRFDFEPGSLELVHWGRLEPSQKRYRLIEGREFISQLTSDEAVEVLALPDKATLEIWLSDGRGLIPRLLNSKPLEISAADETAPSGRLE